jgi:hypothetical protein
MVTLRDHPCLSESFVMGWLVFDWNGLYIFILLASTAVCREDRVLHGGDLLLLFRGL